MKIKEEEKVIEENKFMVQKIVNLFYRKIDNVMLTREDLTQVANMTLIKCWRKFNPALGYKFSTLAYMSIKGSVGNYIKCNEMQIHVPRGKMDQLYSYYSSLRDLGIEDSDFITEKEIKLVSDLPDNEVSTFMFIIKNSRLLAIDYAWDDIDYFSTLGRVAGASEDFSDRLLDKIFIEECLALLPKKWSYIVYERVLKGRDTRDIAKDLAITTGSVRNTCSIALKRLSSILSQN
jgi:RNA polymerase sigma factor (sigma-70 family)